MVSQCVLVVVRMVRYNHGWMDGSIQPTIRWVNVGIVAFFSFRDTDTHRTTPQGQQT